jgi:hypothetical protein
MSKRIKRKASAGELTPAERRKFKKLAQRSKPKAPHGGAREGSGRKAYFRGKAPMPKSFLLTDEAAKILDEACERTGASRNDIVEALIRRFCVEFSKVMLRHVAEKVGDGDAGGS